MSAHDPRVPERKRGRGRDKPVRWSTQRLAEEIGITRSRIQQLRDEGRIPSAKIVDGVWTYDPFPKVLRGKKGVRPGPLTDYINEQEELEEEV